MPDALQDEIDKLKKKVKKLEENSGQAERYFIDLQKQVNELKAEIVKMQERRRGIH